MKEGGGDSNSLHQDQHTYLFLLERRSLGKTPIWQALNFVYTTKRFPCQTATLFPRDKSPPCLI